MRILALGNFQHPWCSEVHFAQEWEALGHTADRMQEPPGGGDHPTLDEIWRRSVDCSLVTWTRTWSLPVEATQLWRAIESRGTATLALHLDRYAGLSREASLSGDPFWTMGTVATPDNDPEAQEVFARLGINHVYSKPAVVSTGTADVLPGRVVPEFQRSVVFLGSYGYHPEHSFRPKLIDWLGDNYPDFKRYGGDTRPGPVRNRDANDLYRSCLVSVGDSCFASHETTYSSDRPWEAVGRGAFLLYPHIDFVADEFKDVESIDFYEPGDLDSLRERIDYWLTAFAADPELRPRITLAGARWVHEHATYKHRFAVLLDKMNLS